MKDNNIAGLIGRNGVVKRYHTEHIIGSETIAEHSWGVAMLCYKLSRHLPIAARFKIMTAALFHDLPEKDTGDIPALAKWKHPFLKTVLAGLEQELEENYGTEVFLTPEETEILKTADMLQLMIFVHNQRLLGNRKLDHVWNNGYEYLSDLTDNTDVMEILFQMEKERGELCQKQMIGK